MTNKACVRVVELICSVMPEKRGKLVGKVGAEYALQLYKCFQKVSDAEFARVCLPIIYEMNTIPSISDFIHAWKRHKNAPTPFKQLPAPKIDPGKAAGIIKNLQKFCMEGFKNSREYKISREKIKERVQAKFKDISDEQIDKYMDLFGWYISQGGKCDGREIIIRQENGEINISLGKKVKEE